MENIFIIFIIAGLLGVAILGLKGGNRRHKRNILTSKTVLEKIRSFEGENPGARAFGYLRKVSPYVYEEILLTVFEEKGYDIKRSKRYSGDGGIDGVVYNKGKKYIIQAKRYKNHIKESHVRDFENCIMRENADGGFFIHTGRTGKERLSSCRLGRLKIISGSKLLDFIRNKEYGKQFELF